MLRRRFDLELNRIVKELANEANGSPFGGSFPSYIESIPGDVRDRVLQDYNLATVKCYDREFYNWREKMLKIRNSELKDNRHGIRMLFIGNVRIVYSFEEVEYEQEMCWQMQKCWQFTWKMCSNKFDYHVQASSRNQLKKPLTFT